MRSQDGPATVLFRLARRKVLGWLVTHPGDEIFVRELARQTRLAPPTVAHEVAELLKAGLVTRRKSGHQVYVAANQASPVFSELQSLFVKTSAVVDVLRSALRPLASQIDTVYLTGAVARGDLRKHCEIDLLVIGDVSAAETTARLSDVKKALGRRINVLAHGPEDGITPADPYVLVAAPRRKRLSSSSGFEPEEP